MKNVTLMFVEEPTKEELAYAEKVAEQFEKDNPNCKVTIGLPKPRPIR